MFVDFTYNRLANYLHIISRICCSRRRRHNLLNNTMFIQTHIYGVPLSSQYPFESRKTEKMCRLVSYISMLVKHTTYGTVLLQRENLRHRHPGHIRYLLDRMRRSAIRSAELLEGVQTNRRESFRSKNTCNTQLSDINPELIPVCTKLLHLQFR